MFSLHNVLSWVRFSIQVESRRGYGRKYSIRNMDIDTFERLLVSIELSW